MKSKINSVVTLKQCHGEPVILSLSKGLILHTILLSFLIGFSCNKAFTPPLHEERGSGGEALIPYSVFTLLSKTDTVFHLGTFAIYHYWDSLNKTQSQPTGYVGYIHFNDTSFYKKALGFIPYDLHGIYEIPIHIERGLIPYLKSKDKSIKDVKVLDEKIIFKTLNAHKWYTLKLIIYAKHNTW